MAEPSRIVVVGAGVAGLAAASRLLERGTTPTLLSSGVGASAMTSGAADLSPWTHTQPKQPSDGALSFVRALQIFDQPGWVASAEGIVRSASAVGARVLPLQNMSGKKIGVADLPRADFRPLVLMEQLNQSDWAKRTRTRFEVVPMLGVVSETELRFPLPAFHRLFDEEARLVRLIQAASALASDVQGLLLGPWLGEGRTRLGNARVLIGETLSPPEGAFGRRFEKARREYCSKLGLRVRAARVERIAQEEGQFRLTLADSEGSTPGDNGTLWADAVVVATGGLVGHGVGVLESITEPSALRVTLDTTAPLFGGARDGWDATQDSGRWVTPPHTRNASRVLHPSGLVFAGDVRRDASPNAPGGTLLGAVQSGLDAADAVLSW